MCERSSEQTVVSLEVDAEKVALKPLEEMDASETKLTNRELLKEVTGCGSWLPQ